jgi:putative phosphoribosyl transferase
MTVSEGVHIAFGVSIIEGDLCVPERATGLVIFAHGSGSSRFSRRNRAVATLLERAGFATLLLDLLTAAEEDEDERTAEHRFNIPLLGDRVIGALDWAMTRDDLTALPVGLFGASTGAAAALLAAAARPDVVRAVVSRGGRPDLAESALRQVRAPTLLIVGGRDLPVIELNREALSAMRVATSLEIVTGATHLFEQPGALEEVARLAVTWFQRYLITTKH